jgi:adenylate cyclase
LESNFRRVFDLFSRLTGQRLARHLTLKGSLDGTNHQDLTVAILDLRYTVRMMSQYGSDHVVGLLDRFFAMAIEVIERSGGEVNKMVGDKLIAVWGLNEGSAPPAERPIAALLDLREGLREWNRQRREAAETSLGWACGIASGQAYVGNIGGATRSDYTVFGEPVVAALAALAAAKERSVDVVLDGSLYRRISQAVVVESVAEFTAGGREGDQYALIGLATDGKLRTGHVPWDMRYGTLAEGAVVYGAGANQDCYVPTDSRHAA